MDILNKVESYQVDQVKKIIANAKDATPGGTILFGDSIIQEFNINKYFDINEHSNKLFNCGCAGATSDLLLHLQPFAVKEYQPNKLIIMIGTNDLSDLYQFDKLEIAFNVYKLITIVRNNNPAIDVVVISPLPIVESKQSQQYRTNNHLRLLGKEIKANAEEFPGVVYLDIFNEFLDDKNQLDKIYTTDGLHLSSDGYDLFAKLIKDYIK